MWASLGGSETKAESALLDSRTPLAASDTEEPRGMLGRDSEGHRQSSAKVVHHTGVGEGEVSCREEMGQAAEVPFSTGKVQEEVVTKHTGKESEWGADYFPQAAYGCEDPNAEQAVSLQQTGLLVHSVSDPVGATAATVLASLVIGRTSQVAYDKGLQLPRWTRVLLKPPKNVRKVHCQPAQVLLRTSSDTCSSSAPSLAAAAESRLHTPWQPCAAMGDLMVFCGGVPQTLSFTAGLPSDSMEGEGALLEDGHATTYLAPVDGTVESASIDRACGQDDEVLLPMIEEECS